MRIRTLTTLTVAAALAACATDKPAAPDGAQARTGLAAPAGSAGGAGPGGGATTKAPVAPVVLKPGAGTGVAGAPGDSVYFDFDDFQIRADQSGAVQRQANFISKSRSKVVLEGFADERGSAEYNLALGNKRALTVKRALQSLGIGEQQIETVSFGEEKPKSAGHDEAAWAQNRRVDFDYRR
ncbi:MAG: OmpA family protein [Burkholderiaceae bacterium]